MSEMILLFNEIILSLKGENKYNMHQDIYISPVLKITIVAFAILIFHKAMFQIFIITSQF